MNDPARLADPTRPVHPDRQLPDVFQALLAVHKANDRHGLARPLRHLVHLRASQINGCAHCIRMHAREAREDGETDARLDHLAGWRHMDDYMPAERAALAWTEALTRLGGGCEPDFGALRAELRQHFSDEQIAALTVEVAMINQWNRIAISRH
ncbi:alkylhydroperoxidase [Lysobacter daejeonensis GH1-9]|uniref:Alkylhydroperoxidase n=1 Tax=Lysobacter daejeonensis GH1-9 TaxID=1385517 RepID=A0A0A0ETU0_9GAMM|nr:carboxymuconolactone decarboxylase family protein [Lysobacter daejeonensis]KGM53665.1 alkylhydroperoxidase [Lysobacter daejeonensis GH1-9]